ALFGSGRLFEIAMLLASAYCAVGLFASSITRNQIIAFIVGMAICLVLSLVDKMLFFFPAGILPVLHYLGASAHFENVAKGIIDTRDLVYFASIAFLSLYGTHFVIQEKR
ncbi:MAG TPA: hypothetical protein PLW83_01860, partial [Deltaproteobacteria bacterium]|nr:hypothetical protein [Deltaproteobacteria bacterium]